MRQVYILAAILLFFSACNEIEGNGEVVTQSHQIAGFQKLRIAVPAEVRFSVSETFSVEITGESNIISDIETAVSNDELSFEFRDNINYRYKATRPLIIYISAPHLKRLRLSGTAKFTTKDALTAGSFVCRGSGSSQIQLASVAADVVEIDLSGASVAQVQQVQGTEMILDASGASEINIDLAEVQTLRSKSSGASNTRVGAGHTLEQRVSVSGSSSFRSPNLLSKSVEVRANGAASVEIYAENTLEAKASGAAEISYHGSPEIESNTSGTGQVSPAKNRISEPKPKPVDTLQELDATSF